MEGARNSAVKARVTEVTSFYKELRLNLRAQSSPSGALHFRAEPGRPDRRRGAAGRDPDATSAQCENGVQSLRCPRPTLRNFVSYVCASIGSTHQ